MSQTEGQVRLWRAPELEGLELVHACYTRCDFPRHVHDEYVLAVMVGGSEELSVGRNVRTVAPGAVIRLNPGQAHSNRSRGPGGAAYRTFYASPELFGRLAEAATGRRSVVFNTPVVRHRGAYAGLLRLHQALERRGSRLQAESAFATALEPLLGDTAAPIARPERGPVRRAREHLDAEYDHNTSLAALSALSGLSAFHLLRSFRDEVGLPPAQYQAHVRVRRAKALLRDGCSLAETAGATGFVDQSHFTRCFKRIVGVTPGIYARSNTVQDAGADRADG